MFFPACGSTRQNNVKSIAQACEAGVKLSICENDCQAKLTEFRQDWDLCARRASVREYQRIINGAIHVCESCNSSGRFKSKDLKFTIFTEAYLYDIIT